MNMKIVICLLLTMNFVQAQETILIRQGQRTNAILNRKFIFMQNPAKKDNNAKLISLSRIKTYPRAKAINKAKEVIDEWDKYASEIEEETSVNAVLKSDRAHL